VDENREWLAQEILAQLPAGVLPDLVIRWRRHRSTIIGVGQAFKAINPACKVVALEPSESCTILCGEIAKHLIEGIADGFVPALFNAIALFWMKSLPLIYRSCTGDAPPGA